MIKGPVGSDSIYAQHDVPAWGYVLTTIAAGISFLLYLNSLMTKIEPKGFIDLEEDRIIITLNDTSTTIKFSSINHLEVLPDYFHDPVVRHKLNRKIKIAADSGQRSFDVALSTQEEERLRLAITINMNKNARGD